MRYWYRSPLGLLVISLVALAALTLLSPAEATLGANARIVYLHGAWVWAALLAWVASGGLGLLGLLCRNTGWQRWSRSLGRTGLLFWITYLPISLWAMQTNWNGLFLAEPRWRVALIFAVSGLLLQLGLALINRLVWDAVANPSFVVILFAVLQTTEKVMHPPGPMLESDFGRIQIFFIGLTGLTLFAAWQVARWLHRLAARQAGLHQG